MLKVTGSANIRVEYLLVVELSEKDWDEMSPAAQTERIDNSVDWMSACRRGTVEDIDIDDVEEMPTEESA